MIFPVAQPATSPTRMMYRKEKDTNTVASWMLRVAAVLYFGRRPWNPGQPCHALLCLADITVTTGQARSRGNNVRSLNSNTRCGAELQGLLTSRLERLAECFESWSCSVVKSSYVRPQDSRGIRSERLAAALPAEVAGQLLHAQFHQRHSI